MCFQEEAFVEISGDDLATGDAFAELIGMAVEVEPSLANRAARDLAASQYASASIAGAHCKRQKTPQCRGHPTKKPALLLLALSSTASA